MKKRHACICILLVLTAAYILPVYGTDEYKDVNSSYWAYSHIKFMSERGVIKGYEDGSFRPDRQVTYAEFIKMIYIAQSGTELEQPGKGHWALNYYNGGIKNGIFTGNDVKISELDKVIPREKMALMTSNCISFSGDTKTEWKNIIGEINDVDDDSDYAYEIAVSYSQGILNGYPDGSFKPGAGLSRAEAAAAIRRYIEKSGEYTLTVEYSGKNSVSNRDFEAEYYDTVLGYKGIEKIIYSPDSDCIGVYSTGIQDISLFVDGKKAMPVVNSKGEYWEENGYYVYVYNVKDMYKSGSEIGISFGAYIEEIFRYKDALM